MADEPSWDDIFSPGTGKSEESSAPTSRRELREREAAEAAAAAAESSAPSADRSFAPPPPARAERPIEPTALTPTAAPVQQPPAAPSAVDPAPVGLAPVDPAVAPSAAPSSPISPAAEASTPPVAGPAPAADPRAPDPSVFPFFADAPDTPVRPAKGGPRQRKPKRKRRFAWLWVLLAFLLVVAGTGSYGWLNYEPQIREVFGWQLPNDYEGTGSGDEVVVVIQAGDIGEDVARTLAADGVTMTFDAFYELLLAQDQQVEFQPGNYSLLKGMSAKAALAALQDPANKITQRVIIPEGTTMPNALSLLAAGTGIPLEEFQAVAKDYTALGVPKEAPSLEGYLFPATYTFDPGVTATSVLQRLVDEMFARLDRLGVAPADRHRVLTLAGLIQREAGPVPEDLAKIARVFTNRLETPGWKLESDASVAYGTGNFSTVWTTDAERADAGNPYNTYVHEGLPVGPIGLPGQAAIEATLKPAKGPWFFFVPVNLKTGETVFSETSEQHEAAAAKLRAWCAESDENASYCA